MINYPVGHEDQVKLSALLANELVATNNLAYILSILTDWEISHLLIWDYVKSPKADPQILRNIARSSNHDTVLGCIAANQVTTVETLTDICSNPEKYFGWSTALDNPKATKEHAMLMINLRKDDNIFSGASTVAFSRFLDDEISEMLFAEYSLVDFDFSILKQRDKKENKEIVEDYAVKLNVLRYLLSNKLVPEKWVEVYRTVTNEQKKYDSGNSLAYLRR